MIKSGKHIGRLGNNHIVLLKDNRSFALDFSGISRLEMSGCRGKLDTRSWASERPGDCTL